MGLTGIRGHIPLIIRSEDISSSIAFSFILIRKAGQMPRPHRSVTPADRAIITEVRGREIRLVSRKYFGNVPKWR